MGAHNQTIAIAVKFLEQWEIRGGAWRENPLSRKAGRAVTPCSERRLDGEEVREGKDLVDRRCSSHLPIIEKRRTTGTVVKNYS